MKSCVVIHLKAVEQCFPVVLFIILQGFLAFKFVDDTVKYHSLNENKDIEQCFRVVLFVSPNKGKLHFESLGWVKYLQV